MSRDPEPAPPTQPRQVRPNNRSWIWFFVVVGVLTVTGVALEIWFNYQQQLTLERVERAWELWRQNGPHDYDLDYTIDERNGGHDVFTVRVRDGKTVGANRLEDGRRVETAQFPYASLDAIFQKMEDWIQLDRQPQRPRVFMTASFDRQDGHLVRLIRSISSTRERVEISVKLRPPTE